MEWVRRESSRKKKAKSDEEPSFTDIVFSWSLADIFNQNLFNNKIKKIPETFESAKQYMDSYTLPLLEETRAQLCSSMSAISSAPIAEIIGLEDKTPYGSLLYDVAVDKWDRRVKQSGKDPYKTLPGDILVLTESIPETVSDLQRVRRLWTYAIVTAISEDENDISTSGTSFKIKTWRNIFTEDKKPKSLFLIYLISTTTNKRIWMALHRSSNLNIVNEVLCTNSVVGTNCQPCHETRGGLRDNELVKSLSSTLNKSQTEAVLSCLEKVQCIHKSTVELIWGPPGTGKTKTVSTMLFTLLKMKCRIAVCAPTNVAIAELAARVCELTRESDETETAICPLGDLLLFGNKDKLNSYSATQFINLDYRVDALFEYFVPLTGWCHHFDTVIDFFEDCFPQYRIYLDNLKSIEKTNNFNSIGSKVKTFLEFARERFQATALPLKECVVTLCTHISKSHLSERNFGYMVSLVGLLDSFQSQLFSHSLVSEELQKIYSKSESDEVPIGVLSKTLLLLCAQRSECLSILKFLRTSLSELKMSARSKDMVADFCFSSASVYFCTASSSFKLHKVAPLDFLVVDEAAQLKECESSIPLQLPGIRHAILIGDEFQLPATVVSKVSEEAGFGRSLFERLSMLCHGKHLLNIQYRMHPSISCFPNAKFYHNQILDAPNVMCENYQKQYLCGSMFGTYSFINITAGKEELDKLGRSRKNIYEVAVAVKLVQDLYKAFGRKHNLSIGVISPYAAQVAEIQYKIGSHYKSSDGFSLKVKSVDGFQGGEADIVIISTVRSNRNGSIGFLDNLQRTNVALTRARHSLWILGNGNTLINSESVWGELIQDAKERKCFYDAEDDKELAKIIIDLKLENNDLDDLIDGDSVFFKKSKWKVIFSDNFKKSFQSVVQKSKRKTIFDLLLRLSSGWRPKDENVDIVCERSSLILKKFRVLNRYIVCSIDVSKDLNYKQVLKVWDLLPMEDIPNLVKRLDAIFKTYPDDLINQCNEKCIEGELVAPKICTGSFDACMDSTITILKPFEGWNSCYLTDELLSEAEVLGKCGHYRDACLLLLWYVFASSLWSTGSKGWPLKSFKQKEYLLTRAKSLAINESNQFYEYVCIEANILSKWKSDLPMLMQHLTSSLRFKSLRAEVVSARKILDYHIFCDLPLYMENRICGKSVSIEALVYFWNFWKDRVIRILEYLELARNQDADEHINYRDFCLNYFGLWRQSSGSGTTPVYILLNPKAEWARGLEKKDLTCNGNFVSVDFHHFISAASNYWCLEFTYVGIKVLKLLERLYYFSFKNSSEFYRSSCLVHIYKVTKFLQKSKFVKSTLHRFIKTSTMNIFSCVFPLTWKESLKENMIHLRETEALRDLLEDVILEMISSKKKLSYREIGRLVTIVLGSGKLKEELHLQVKAKLEQNTAWKALIENIGCRRSAISNFHIALADTCNGDWRKGDNISHHCFLYLIERLLFLVASFKRHIICPKSIFIDWLVSQETNERGNFGIVLDEPKSVNEILEFMLRVIRQILYSNADTIQWIRTSHINVEECHSLLVTRLVVLICLIYLNFGSGLNLLVDALTTESIAALLPQDFYEALEKGVQMSFPNAKNFYDSLKKGAQGVHNGANLDTFTDAFETIGNPLVNVVTGDPSSQLLCRDVVSVNLDVYNSKEEIMKILFPKTDRAVGGNVEMEAADLPLVSSPSFNLEVNIREQQYSSNVPTVEQLCERLKFCELNTNPGSSVLLGHKGKENASDIERNRKEEQRKWNSKVTRASVASRTQVYRPITGRSRSDLRARTLNDGSSN